MKGNFFKNLLFLLLLNFLIKPFYILKIGSDVQAAVGDQEYGVYFALLNFSFLLNIILDAGINNFNTRNIAQHSQLVQKHMAGIITLRIGLAALYIGVSLVLALVLGYTGRELWMLVVLMLNQVLAAFILYFRSNLGALHLFKTDSIISVLDRTLLVIFCLILLGAQTADMPFQIEWFIYAQTVAYGLTMIVALLAIKWNAGNVKLNWNRQFNYLILKKSFPYALLILLMTFYYRADSVMLERMIADGAEQAGIYAKGYRFFEASNMIAYLFAALLLPIFSRMLKQQEDLNELVGFSFTLLFSGALILALASCFFAEDIMYAVYGEAGGEVVHLFGVLMCCFLAICTTYIFGTLLTANGNLKALNWMAAGGMVLNILLNCMLIYSFKAEGCAWASLITQVLTAAIQVGLAQYFFRFRVKLILLVRFVFFLGVLIGLGFVVRLMDVGLLYRLLVFTGAGVLFMFITGLLKPKEISKLLLQDKS